MGKLKQNSRVKSSETVRDPHFTEFDTQKERNIQPNLNQPDRPTHP